MLGSMWFVLYSRTRFNFLVLMCETQRKYETNISSGHPVAQVVVVGC